MSGPLALIAEDVDGGFNVVDARDGEAVAWRGELPSAADVATFLNSTYPPGAVAPSHDSLVHELICWRVGGDEADPIERWLETASALCPSLIPRGPGWDHLPLPSEGEV